MKSYLIEDDNNTYTMHVGESAKENWSMLSQAEQWYYFFHLSSFPSGYGMLECENGEEVSTGVLQQCAAHVIKNTKYRNIRNIKVDCTTYVNVKRGDRVGEVIYKKARDIIIL